MFNCSTKPHIFTGYRCGNYVPFQNSVKNLKTAKTRTRIYCEPKDVEIAEVNPNVCPGCGIDLSEVPNNCDQDGHIASGLGAVVGFEWWPIKVYRPCPAFEAAGKTYVRKGQITNEILFRKKERTEM